VEVIIETIKIQIKSKADPFEHLLSYI